MNKKILNILADAISDVGSWNWWYEEDDMVQLEFRDIQLYDETKSARETHTTDVIAIRFCGNAFAVFLDNLDEARWYEHFRDEDSIVYSVDTYNLAFDDVKEAEALLRCYKNWEPIKGYAGLQTIYGARHLLYARCGEVGFVAGGDEMSIVGHKGLYTEDEIETGERKWWEYWKEYWKLRGTKDAYPKDYACEITIPVKRG